jgi:hypothetical protein
MSLEIIDPKNEQAVIANEYTNLDCKRKIFLYNKDDNHFQLLRNVQINNYGKSQTEDQAIVPPQEGDTSKINSLSSHGNEHDENESSSGTESETSSDTESDNASDDEENDKRIQIKEVNDFITWYRGKKNIDINFFKIEEKEQQEHSDNDGKKWARFVNKLRMDFHLTDLSEKVKELIDSEKICGWKWDPKTQNCL